MKLSKPIPYTKSPTTLLFNDVLLFVQITFIWPITAGLPSIVLPFWPFRSGALDELYPSPANLWAITLHIILLVTQTTFLLALIPSALIGLPIPFYAPIYFLSVVVFVMGNKWFCILLNGRRKKFCSRVDLTAYSRHDEERWIFINGVAAGSHWMQSNLDRLALAFRREIHGIHNQTRGIIFDVIECAIQRDFSYATGDIREAYEDIAETLSNDQYKRVVLICHSQGAIEGAMVLDWLYDTVPSDQIARLEVYTFGNAANHFNAPVRSCLSSKGHRADEPPLPEGRREIKHIEHYANTNDYVSKFGILNFRPCFLDSHSLMDDDVHEEENRFVGTLFRRAGSGHQFNGNYLDNLFPMNSEMTEVLEHNEFMDGIVDQVLYANCDVVAIQGADKCHEKDTKNGPPRKVKELSRLWNYRNGMSPEE